MPASFSNLKVIRFPRLEEYNTLLENSRKRRLYWQMKDRSRKSILTPVGSIRFTRTRFLNKETVETAYLLDRILGWEPHTRISDGEKAGILEVAAQGSYENAGESSCQGEDRVNRNTVMRQVRGTAVLPEGREEASEKRKVKYLYVDPGLFLCFVYKIKIARGVEKIYCRMQFAEELIHGNKRFDIKKLVGQRCKGFI